MPDKTLYDPFAPTVADKLKVKIDTPKPIEGENETISTVYGQSFKPMNVDVDEYKNYFKNKEVPYNTSPDFIDALNEARANNQSGIAALGKSIPKIGTEAVSMMLSGTGALFHPEAVLGQERKENAAESLANWINKSMDEALPIYKNKKETESFSPIDAKSLAEALPGAIGAVAMMIPALGVVKGVGLIGKSLAALSNVEKITAGAEAIGEGMEAASALPKVANTTNLFGKAAAAIETTQTPLGAGIISGVTNGHINAYVMSAGTYEQLHEEGLQLGMSEPEAKAYAGEGAGKAYKLGLANMAFEFAEMGVLFKGTNALSRGIQNLTKTERNTLLDFSKGITGKEVEDEAIKNTLLETMPVKSKWNSALNDYGKMAGLGATNLVAMDLYQEEGKHYVEQKYGVDTKDSSVFSRIADNITKNNVLKDAFIGGISGLLIEKGLKQPYESIFKKHYDNEENRINNFINSSRELKTKLGLIQQLQSEGKDYSAEAIHGEILNDMFLHGIKNGTYDLHLKMFENLAKSNFDGISDTDKVNLENQGLSIESPKLAAEIYKRAKEAKPIFEKHLTKDYLKGIQLEDQMYNNDLMRNTLSLYASNLELNLKSTQETLDKAATEETGLAGKIINPVNEIKDGTTYDFILNKAQHTATKTGLESVSKEISSLSVRNDMIEEDKRILKNNNKLSTSLEQMLNFEIENNKKIIEYKNQYKSELQTLHDEHTIQLEKDKTNYENGLHNIEHPDAEKRPTEFSNENVREIQKTLENTNLEDDLEKVTEVTRQRIELGLKRDKLNNEYTEFIKNPDVRKTTADNMIRESKSQVKEKRDTYTSAVKDLIIRNSVKSEDIESDIKELQNVVDAFKKSDGNTLQDLIKESEDVINKWKIAKEKATKEETRDNEIRIKAEQAKRREEEIKARREAKKKDNKSTTDDVIQSKDDTPREKKDDISKIHLNDIKLKSVKDDITNEDVENASKQDTKVDNHKIRQMVRPDKLDELKENKEGVEKVSGIVDNFYNIFDNTFRLSLRNKTSTLRKGINRDTLIANINKLNAIKDEYTAAVEKEKLTVPDGDKNRLVHADLSNTELDNLFYANGMAEHIRLANETLDRLNVETKQTEPVENKVEYNFGLNKEGNSNLANVSKNIADLISVKYSDLTTRAEKGNALYDAIKKYNDANEDSIETAKKELVDAIMSLHEDDKVKPNIKFSKRLTGLTEEVTSKIKDSKLDQSDNDLEYLRNSFNLSIAFNAYTKHSKSPFSTFIASTDLMTALYLENPKLVDLIGESVNKAIAVANVMRKYNTSLQFTDEKGNKIKLPYDEILEKSEAKVIYNVQKFDLNEIKKRIQKRIEAANYVELPSDAIFMPLPGEKDGRQVIKNTLSLTDDPNIPDDAKFQKWIESVVDLKQNDELELRYAQGDNKTNELAIYNNGTKIGNISSLAFEYRGIKYYKENENGTYDFSNPFEILDIDTKRKYEILNKFQSNILSDIYWGKFRETSLEQLKEGKYKSLEDSEEDQKELHSMLSFFSRGVSNKDSNTPITLDQCKQFVSPFFIGTNKEGFTLTAEEMKNRVTRHVNRFRTDFENVKALRTNPDTFKVKFERSSNAEILHDDTQSYLLNQNIKPINGKITIGVLSTKNNKDITLYDSVSGEILNCKVKHGIEGDNRQMMHIVLDSHNGGTVAHKVNAATLRNARVKDKQYKADSEERINKVASILCDYFKRNVGDDEVSFINTKEKLRSSTIVKDDYFKVFMNNDGTVDNFHITVVDKWDSEKDKPTSLEHYKISKDRKGSGFIIYKSELPKGEDKAVVDASKEALNTKQTEVVHTVKSIESLEKLLREEYVHKMLRNFEYDDNKINPEYEKEYLDKTTGKLHKLDENSHTQNAYLDFLINTGAIHSNIGFIKGSDGKVLSNFNLGSDSSIPYNIHVKSERILEVEKPDISKITSTEELRDSNKFPNFKKYKFLLDGIDPFAIENDSNTEVAHILGKTIYMNFNGLKNLKVEDELAHELIHARLDIEFPKLSDLDRIKVSTDIANIRTRIDNAINDEGIKEKLTSDEKLKLGEFIKEVYRNINETVTNPDGTDKKVLHNDLGTLQEMFTYTYTRPEIYEALSKIEYKDGESTSMSLWDKLVELVYTALGIKDKSIIDNINEILKSSLSPLESNISKLTEQLPEQNNLRALKPSDNINISKTDINTNVNSEVKEHKSSMASKLSKRKNSTQLYSENDYKIVNLSEFKQFSEANKDHFDTDLLEYFKKCY